MNLNLGGKMLVTGKMPSKHSMCFLGLGAIYTISRCDFCHFHAFSEEQAGLFHCSLFFQGHWGPCVPDEYKPHWTSHD